MKIFIKLLFLLIKLLIHGGGGVRLYYTIKILKIFNKDMITRYITVVYNNKIKILFQFVSSIIIEART